MTPNMKLFAITYVGIELCTVPATSARWALRKAFRRFGGKLPRYAVRQLIYLTSAEAKQALVEWAK